MSKEELKTEIQKLINQVPENMLEEIYNILKEIANKSPDSVRFSHNLNKILTEDKKLLERLAQ